MQTVVMERVSSVGIGDNYLTKLRRDPYPATPAAKHKLVEYHHNWYVMVK